MNRQQRRQLAKKKEVEAKFFRELRMEQGKIHEDVSMVHMIAYALALHDLGFGDVITDKVIQAANGYLSSLDGETVTMWTLADELERKTGIEIVWDNK